MNPLIAAASVIAAGLAVLTNWQELCISIKQNRVYVKTAA